MCNFIATKHMVFPFPLGRKFLPVEAKVMPLLVKPEEEHFEVKEDPARVTDTETRVGIGGASRNRKRHCPEEGLISSLSVVIWAVWFISSPRLV